MQRNITRSLCLNANQYCGMKIWQEIPYSDIDCPIQQICMNCPIKPCIYYDDYPWFGRYKTNNMQPTQKLGSNRCSGTRGWLSRMTKGGVCSPQVLKAFLNSPNTCDQKLLENYSDDPFVSRSFNPNVPFIYGGDLQDNIGKWNMRRIRGNGEPFAGRSFDPNVSNIFGGDLQDNIGKWNMRRIHGNGDPFAGRSFDPNVSNIYGGDLQDNIGKWNMRRIDGNRLQSKDDSGDPFVGRSYNPNVPTMYGGDLQDTNGKWTMRKIHGNDYNEGNRPMEVYGEANMSLAKSFADYGNYANIGAADLERYKQIMAMTYNGNGNYPNRLPGNENYANNYANNYAKNYDYNYGNYGNNYVYNYGDNYASQDPKYKSSKKMMNAWIKSLYEFYNDVAGGPEVPKRKFRNHSSFYSSGRQFKSQYNMNRKSHVALRSNKSGFLKKSRKSKHNFSSKSREKQPWYQIYYHEPYDPNKPWTFRQSVPNPFTRDKSNSAFPFNRQEWLAKVIQEIDRDKITKPPEDNESTVRLREELQRKSRSFPSHHLSSHKVRN